MQPKASISPSCGLSLNLARTLMPTIRNELGIRLFARSRQIVLLRLPNYSSNLELIHEFPAACRSPRFTKRLLENGVTAPEWPLFWPIPPRSLVVVEP